MKVLEPGRHDTCRGLTVQGKTEEKVDQLSEKGDKEAVTAPDGNPVTAANALSDN